MAQSALVCTGMDGMESHWGWLGLAVLLLIIEMYSGTLYLLAIAGGFALAGIASVLGAGWMAQMTVAALVCTVAVVGIYRWRGSQPASAVDSNLSSEMGQPVHIVHWQDAHHARVSYRGAEWDARLADGVAPEPERAVWHIRALQGNRLIIE